MTGAGYQPRNTPAERRAFFDIDNRLREFYATKSYVDARTPKIVAGSTTATTNASGQVTITHGLGVTPQVVLVSTTTASVWLLAPGTYTATTFTVTVRNILTSGALVTSTAGTFNWIAVA